MGCFSIIGIIVVIGIIIAVVSGGDEDKVSTGSDSSKSSSEQSTKEEGTKTIDATSQSAQAAGLNVNLGEIKVSEDKIEVGINVENTNSDLVSFYPDQGSAVIGDMQLDANMFLTDGSISGDIQGGVKQEAVLEFLAPEGKTIDPESVKDIKLVLGDVTSADYMTSEPVEFTVTAE